MRSHHTPSGAVRNMSRAAGERGESVPSRVPPQVPMEWLDAGSWRLPSGKALAEFALQAGFLAPVLFRGERSRTPKASALRSSEIAGSVASTSKQFGKGDGR